MKIVAPIDSSRFSQAAIDSLMGMSWDIGTEIKLVTVVSKHDGHAPADGAWDFGTTTDDAQQALAGIANELQQAMRGCQVSYAVRLGDPKSQIVHIAEEWNADLIVMGSRGHRGLERLLLGSVSQAVLSHSPCPVIVAKSEGYSESFDVQGGFKTILVAVDSSAYARAAMEWLAQFSWPRSTNFRMITVIESISSRFAMESSLAKAASLAQEHEALWGAARDGLSDMGVELAGMLQTENISIEVGEGDPCDVILNAAEKIAADLIVIGSHGRTGVSKLLLGSVSQSVSAQAPCAVAVVRGVVSKNQAMMQKTGVFKVPDMEKLRAQYAPVETSSAATSNSTDDFPNIYPSGMMG